MFAIVSTRTRGPQLLPLVTSTPALIFWGLDAYYLHQERMFRKLYEAAAHRLATGSAAPDISPFDMDASRYSSQVPGLLPTLFAGHVLAIPAMLTVLVVAYTLMSA